MGLKFRVLKINFRTVRSKGLEFWVFGFGVTSFCWKRLASKQLSGMLERQPRGLVT